MSQDLWTDAERAVLRARARHLAQPPQPEDARRAVLALRVRVAGERYAIDAGIVLAVSGLRRICPLPHAPEHVAGVISHASVVLPAFHLRGVFSLPLVTLPERGHVLVVGRGQPAFALIVDAAERSVAVDPEKLAPAPETMTQEARALIRGIDTHGVPYIDTQALLGSKRLDVDITLPHTEEGALR